MQFIDTHIHLWNLDNNINKWVVNSNNSRLIHNYTLDDYTSTYPSATEIITVEAADGVFSLNEVAWIHQYVKNNLIKIKHIAYIDMMQNPKQFETSLQQFRQYNFVIGFRDTMSFSKSSNYSPCNADMTTDKTKLDNLAHNLICLAQNNYIFNAQMYPSQLLQISNIIRNSSVNCIIDHCGLPDFTTSESKNEWLNMLHEYGQIAKFKISGLNLNNNNENITEICENIFKILQRLLFTLCVFRETARSFSDKSNYKFS